MKKKRKRMKKRKKRGNKTCEDPKEEVLDGIVECDMRKLNSSKKRRRRRRYRIHDLFVYFQK